MSEVTREQVCVVACAEAFRNDGEILASPMGDVPQRAVALAKAGEMRILAVTSNQRVPAFAAAPTLKEQGFDATFVNWRGFFAAPGLPEAKAKMYRKAIAEMYATPEWEAVRKRNGWVNIHKPGKEFTAFLVDQETVIKNLMKRLGFLK